MKIDFVRQGGDVLEDTMWERRRKWIKFFRYSNVSIQDGIKFEVMINKFMIGLVLFVVDLVSVGYVIMWF